MPVSPEIEAQVQLDLSKGLYGPPDSLEAKTIAASVLGVEPTSIPDVVKTVPVITKEPVKSAAVTTTTVEPVSDSGHDKEYEEIAAQVKLDQESGPIPLHTEETAKNILLEARKAEVEREEKAESERAAQIEQMREQAKLADLVPIKIGSNITVKKIGVDEEGEDLFGYVVGTREEA